MPLSHHLFGDFLVEYRSRLSLSEATSRLVAIADESLKPHSGRGTLLHGYVTKHEIFLYQGSTLFINPFRPHFIGALEEKEGVVVLRGKIAAMGLFKFCLSAGSLALILAIFSAAFLPQHVDVAASPGEFILVLGIQIGFLIALRAAMLPTSPLVRSLEDVIVSAISGERPNQSFKRTPDRLSR